MRHEDWSEFQRMTDLVLKPAACYPVYPAIAARGALPPGGVIGRRRRRLRLPPRALRRPGPPADLPPARDRPHRRAGDGGRVARPLARPRARAAALGRPRRHPDVASDPFFGRGGRLLAAQPARPGAEVRGARADRRRRSRPRSPRSTTTRTTSARSTGSRWTPTATHRPHRLPRLRPRADHAGAAPRARPRPGRLAGGGAGRAGALMATAPAGDGQPARPRPGGLRAAISLHGPDRDYAETNCYTDILIEFVHAIAARAPGDDGLRRCRSTSRATSGPSSSRARRTSKRSTASTSTRCSPTGRCPSRSPSRSRRDGR